MKNSVGIRFAYGVTLLLILMVLQGCATLKPRQTFNNEADEVIQQVLKQSARSLRPMQSVAVVSAAARNGQPVNRLEEAMVEKITNRLKREQRLYRLTRQNWFELREGRPLTFSGHSAANQTLLQQLMIFEVRGIDEPLLENVRVQITATDATGRDVVGIMAEKEFTDADSQPWRKLFAKPAKNNPYPEGLEEHPYTSLDRFSYSLASELTDSYRTGVQAGGESIADRDINVVLYSKHNTPQSLAIQNAVQQAIIAQQGFTCSLSQSDMGAAFNQLEQYRGNPSVFSMEQVEFSAGTVLLMLDVIPSASETVSAALRGVWRVSPMETKNGRLIPSNYSGSYLSGFTAKAYLTNVTSQSLPTVVTPTRYQPLDSKALLYHRAPQRGFE